MELVALYPAITTPFVHVVVLITLLFTHPLIIAIGENVIIVVIGPIVADVPPAIAVGTGALVVYETAGQGLITGHGWIG